MHHLNVWAGSITNGATLANLPAPVDSIMTVYNTNTYLPPKNTRILRAYAMGDNVTKVQLDSPLTRPIGPPQVQPIDANTEPSTLPPINIYDENALPWLQNDPMGILISRGGAAAAVCFCAFWTADQVQGKIGGASWPVPATTASTTYVAGQWVPQNLTITQNLPPGRWKVIGMAAQGTSLFAARLIFPMQASRPGVIAQDAYAEYDTELFRRGNFGDFGEFDAFAPPTIELMGLAAGANTALIWLDLQPMSGQAPRF